MMEFTNFLPSHHGKSRATRDINKNKHNTLAETFKTTGPPGSTRRSLEDNIKVYLK